MSIEIYSGDYIASGGERDGNNGDVEYENHRDMPVEG